MSSRERYLPCRRSMFTCIEKVVDVGITAFCIRKVEFNFILYFTYSASLPVSRNHWDGSGSCVGHKVRRKTWYPSHEIQVPWAYTMDFLFNKGWTARMVSYIIFACLCLYQINEIYLLWHNLFRQTGKRPLALISLMENLSTSMHKEKH